MGEGRALSIIGAPPIKNEFQGLRRHSIEASLTNTSPSDPNTEIYSFLFPVIEIEIEEPAELRLYIKIRCKNEHRLPFFYEMLGEIAKFWPETETAI